MTKYIMANRLLANRRGLSSAILVFASILFLAGALLGGCKNNDMGTDDANFGQAQGNQSKDITDTSSCVGTPPANASIFGSWTYSTKNPQLGEREDVTVTVQHNSMTATAVCTAAGVAHSISATAPCVVTGVSIKTASADTEEINIAPECKVAIPQGTLNYTLIGNCAVIKINRHITTMVRAGL